MVWAASYFKAGPLWSSLEVEFDDVIAEPEGTYSVDCVWKGSNRLFTCSKNCCYKTLTLICALPIAFISGCTFACLTFQHIWCVSPALRQCRINCYMVRQYLTSVLDSCLGPCCSEIGLCLSRIRIGRYQLTSTEVV
ncbi:UNVERIFIED_CONTAM: Caveolin-2 [Trichonephila clavipes]